MNPRIQGDIGERAAAAWLLRHDAVVAFPHGHSPDCDLWAEIDRAIYRIQVKTTTRFHNGRWVVTVSTSGGNQSWNHVVRLMDPSRCDYLFVLVGDGRQWFIPSGNIGGGRAICLGGRKYARFEVESSEPLVDRLHRQAARSRIFATRGDARVAKGIAL